MNLYRIKKKIRNSPSILYLLSSVYNVVMMNRFKGKKGLKINRRGAFLSQTKIINTGNNNTINVGLYVLKGIRTALRGKRGSNPSALPG